MVTVDRSRQQKSRRRKRFQMGAIKTGDHVQPLVHVPIGRLSFPVHLGSSFAFGSKQSLVKGLEQQRQSWNSETPQSSVKYWPLRPFVSFARVRQWWYESAGETLALCFERTGI